MTEGTQSYAVSGGIIDVLHPVPFLSMGPAGADEFAVAVLVLSCGERGLGSICIEVGGDRRR